MEQADNARDGLFMAASERFDAMVLERVLPHSIDGLRLIGTLRAQSNSIPVLILSTRATVEDRVAGLQAGSDDYLAKPCDIIELVARVEGLNRRDRGATKVARLVVEDLELDMVSRSVRRAGREIELPPREFLLLQFLMRNAGRVVTRTMLMEGVWNYNFFPQTNLVDTHISCLRQKVDKPFPTRLIHTVRGAGYMMDGPRPGAPTSLRLMSRQATGANPRVPSRVERLQATASRFV